MRIWASPRAKPGIWVDATASWRAGYRGVGDAESGAPRTRWSLASLRPQGLSTVMRARAVVRFCFHAFAMNGGSKYGRPATPKHIHPPASGEAETETDIRFRESRREGACYESVAVPPASRVGGEFWRRDGYRLRRCAIQIRQMDPFHAFRRVDTGTSLRIRRSKSRPRGALVNHVES